MSLFVNIIMITIFEVMVVKKKNLVIKYFIII